MACFALLFTFATIAQGSDQPNILWLTTEDVGPELSCYGDSTAETPALDSLAKKGLVFDIAWSNYPVCAPARTTIITGMYASSLGAGHMRSSIPLPSGFQLLPEYLGNAGYYCTNNSKTDYNVIPHQQVWDESSKKAHYRNREPGQPFFAVFNYTGTHESKIRVRPHKSVVDPASVKLKSYWPDVPEVRQDLAQYYDNIQSLDGWVQKKLTQLEKDGLVESTIVVFFGDHGSGMPRHKRFAGDSGQRVPFIVHVPEKFQELAPDGYKAGGHTSHLVGFVDLAPTMLSLAGIDPPETMEGHAFMGRYKEASPEFLFGYRDRMDERPDLSRAIRDKKFVYIRNFMPHLPPGQFLEYQQETPTTSVWYELFLKGKLSDVQSQFWQPHPPEQLFDLTADPEETINLARDSRYDDVLRRFRNAQREQIIKSRDLGFMNEGELSEITKSGSPSDFFKKVDYPIERILETATMASDKNANLNEFVELMNEPNTSIRYWAATGLRIQAATSAKEHGEFLEVLLDDSAPAVSILAADILANHGAKRQVEYSLAVLARHADFNLTNWFHAINALNAIDRLDKKALPILQLIHDLPVESNRQRVGGYLQRLVKSILRDIEPNRESGSSG